MFYSPANWSFLGSTILVTGTFIAVGACAAVLIRCDVQPAHLCFCFFHLTTHKRAGTFVYFFAVILYSPTDYFFFFSIRTWRPPTKQMNNQYMENAATQQHINRGGSCDHSRQGEEGGFDSSEGMEKYQTGIESVFNLQTPCACLTMPQRVNLAWKSFHCSNSIQSKHLQRHLC